MHQIFLQEESHRSLRQRIEKKGTTYTNDRGADEKKFSSYCQKVNACGNDGENETTREETES